MRLPAWSRQKFNIHALVPLLTLVVESDPPHGYLQRLQSRTTHI